MSNTQTRVLLEQWHGGDAGALENLLARNLDWVRGRVVKRMGPLLAAKGSATDYVQDACMELMRYGPRFVMSDEAQFRALLAKIIENVLRGRHDWFTAQRRDAAKEVAAGTESVLDFDAANGSVTRPSEAFAKRESREWIRLGIALLDTDDQEVIVLRQWDGLSFQEIGERLEIAEDSARMRFNRALPKLAEKVDQLRRGDFETLLGETLTQARAEL